MIQLEHIRKSYGSNEVLKGISGRIAPGDVVAIIGPSGSGKSTLLRTINLLDPPTSGKVYINDTCITEKGINIEEIRTKIGMVFQQFNLFSHMTILENITYAPRKVKKMPPQKAEKLAKKLLKQVGLSNKEQAYPASLSGGQKQRAAIARALAMNPEIILFDEPTSALDPEMVKEVLNVIKELVNTGITIVIVTHEMAFAREVADYIWFIDEGHLVENTLASSFFKKTKTKRAAEFLEQIL